MTNVKSNTNMSRHQAAARIQSAWRSHTSQGRTSEADYYYPVCGDDNYHCGAWACEDCNERRYGDATPWRFRD